MQTPPEILFQGMTGTPEIEEAIAAQVAQLEERSGRITACRVVVKAPGQHHRKGGLYEVHIRLALPDGREVNVERTPPQDERHADLKFALSDAFRHARRQLEDQVRRTRGEVKHHDGPRSQRWRGSIRPASSASLRRMTARRFISTATACSTTIFRGCTSAHG